MHLYISNCSFRSKLTIKQKHQKRLIKTRKTKHHTFFQRLFPWFLFPRLPGSCDLCNWRCSTFRRQSIRLPLPTRYRLGCHCSWCFVPENHWKNMENPVEFWKLRVVPFTQMYVLPRDLQDFGRPQSICSNGFLKILGLPFLLRRFEQAEARKTWTAEPHKGSSQVHTQHTILHFVCNKDMNVGDVGDIFWYESVWSFLVSSVSFELLLGRLRNCLRHCWGMFRWKET